LRYGHSTRIIVRVKTTIELDEQKLIRVMQLTGLKTRREAIDYALDQAERSAKLAKLFGRKKRSKAEISKAMDPNYDVLALREQEKPEP
jgi:Arc/MetJ family transcription regulator